MVHMNIIKKYLIYYQWLDNNKNYKMLAEKYCITYGMVYGIIQSIKYYLKKHDNIPMINKNYAYKFEKDFLPKKHELILTFCDL